MTIATLIVDIATNQARLVSEVEKVNGSLDKVGGFAAKAGSMIAGAFTVTAVVGFANHVASVASNIHDMALKLGISTDAVQRFKFAAEQSGASLDDVGRALNFMNKALAEGDKGTVRALEMAGLSLRDIRQLKPEQAFLAIADAVKEIPDPMTRAQVQTALFGRGALALAAAINEGFGDIGKHARVMSTETINELEKAQDTWARVVDSITIYSGKLLAVMLSNPNVTRTRVDLTNIADTAAMMAKIPAPPMFTARGVSDLKLADGELDRINDTLDDQRKVLDKAGEKAREHAESIARLRDELTGKGAIRAANDMVAALRGGISVQQLTDDAQKRINQTMAEAIEVYRLQGKVAPEAMRLLYIETLRLPPAISGITAELLKVGQQVDVTIPKIDNFGQSWEVVAGIPFASQIGQQVDLTIPKFEKAKFSVEGLAQSLAQLAQVSGGTFSGMARDLATLITSIDTAHQSVGQLKDGMKSYKEGDTWQGILGMTSGIIGITSAAITAVKAIANLFDRNKGRDLVVDFAENIGGFDALHEALLRGGDAGEGLWIKLTQGVGRNNPQQAAAAIAEVQAFLDRLGNTTVSPQINPQVNWPDDVPGGEPDGAASGGLVSRGRILHFGRGGFVPRGTDTVPAMLTPGEIILNAAQQRRVAGQMAGTDDGPVIQVFIGNDQLDGRMVKVARRDAARGGLRPRAVAGRSY